MTRAQQLKIAKSCPEQLTLAIHDTLNAMHGKWKLPIIGSLLYGKKRFKELERTIPKITPRMLSKELKDLEVNGIVVRTVRDTIPVAVEYELTKSGYKLKEVLYTMVEWGMEHRSANIGKSKLAKAA